jgi:hypothetical protein
LSQQFGYPTIEHDDRAPMNPSPPIHPDELLRQVVRGFQELGAQVPGQEAVEETILLRGGVYYGRAYRLGGFLATYVAATGVVEFFDRTGRSRRVVYLGQRTIAGGTGRAAA